MNTWPVFFSRMTRDAEQKKERLTEDRRHGATSESTSKFSVIAIAEAFEVRSTANLSEDDLNGPIVKLKTNTEDLFAIAERKD